MAAFGHQDYPFDELVRLLDMPQDPSRNPLFDVMVVLQNTRALDGPMGRQNAAANFGELLNKAGKKRAEVALRWVSKLRGDGSLTLRDPSNLADEASEWLRTKPCGC